MISEIEDTLIETLRDTGVFRVVDSLGRKALPATITCPAAYLFFSGDKKMDKQKGRKPYTLMFTVEVLNKNLQSENAAAKDTYHRIDAVTDAIDGKDLGLEAIMPFDHIGTEFHDYDPASGVISYWIHFETVIFRRRVG